MNSAKLSFIFTRFSSSSSRVVDWSKPGKYLSVAEKQQYLKNGYVLVRNVISATDLKRYEDKFVAICERKVKPHKSMLIMKDVSIAKKVSEKSVDTVTKIQDFTQDPDLFAYCEHEKVAGIVRDLVGTPNSNIQAMHTMLINKPPDTGKLTSRHPMHQDMIYFSWRPEDMSICAWTAMEKITRKNGCLQIVPGTHKLGLKEHEYPQWEGGVNKAYYAIKDYDLNLPREYVEMEAGDTVFFHPLLFHGSGVNRSDGFRKAISCHYANYDESNYIDVKGTIQEQVESEILTMVKKRIPLEADATLSTIWRHRSRPVHHDGKKNL